MTTQKVTTAGSGLVFNNTYDASCTQAYINCIVAAEQQLEGLFGNSVTINISFTEKALGTNNFLATNSWPSFVNVSYAQLKSKLPASDGLPATDPTGGHTWSLPEAYARMLGLSTSTPSVDDTVTLNTSFTWTFGQDVINAVEHEITEGAMGRVGGLGDQNSVWSTLDLFRWSAPGIRDFTDGRDGLLTYFSVNGLPLNTSLPFHNEYNILGAKVDGDDVADFDALDVWGFGNPAETNGLSQTDIAVMRALGWTQGTQRVAPTVTGQSFSVPANQSAALSSHITVANPSGDVITTYWIEDIGGGSGHLTVAGATQVNGQMIQVGSNWSNVQYVAGLNGGTDSLELAMFDATTGNYVYSPTFTAISLAHVAPTIIGQSFSVSTNHSAALAPHIAATNPSGDNITSYWVEDIGGGSGHLALNGVAQVDGQWIQVGSSWNNVQYVGGSTGGVDTLELAMYDATIGSYVYSQNFSAFTIRPTLPVLQGLTTDEQQVESMYVAYFGRAGDPGGTHYWMQNLDTGQAVDDVAMNFAKQQESSGIYPFLKNLTTNSEANRIAFIDSIYENLFNRAPDTDGLNYWDRELANDQRMLTGNDLFRAIGGFILEVVRGALNTSAGQDITSIQNKVTVASYFTDQLDIHGLNYANNLPASIDSQAHAVVAATSSTSASVSSAIAAINADIQLDLTIQNGQSAEIVGAISAVDMHV